MKELLIDELTANNEDDTVVRNVLPFAMLCHHNAQDSLSAVGFSKRNLFFVYNRIDPTDAAKFLTTNRLTMMDTLEDRKRERQMIEGSSKAGDPFSLISQSEKAYDQRMSIYETRLSEVKKSH